ncbi:MULTISPECIES: hypothetical protein [Halomonas]|uniref:Uncharacterized protein n=1 Tax=Halomonas ventosae TaxID=229007 RepID=A0A4R6GNI8_9GAMM|nr:hypothetical protein [Halomonas ventosae]TDN96811.1 hypothetical protein DFO68_1336 [Halomonas ventosae]
MKRSATRLWLTFATLTKMLGIIACHLAGVLALLLGPDTGR